MSSPTKQVTKRSLPPLPNQTINSRRVGIPGRSPKITDIEEREALLSKVGLSEINGTRTSMSGPESKPTTIIEVVDFLNKNPKALENYILESVSRERLERWLIRKIHADKTDNKEMNKDSLASLSRWKFCVHEDKRKILQHLTQEIHREPQRDRIMFELVKSIAVAIHADKFSLYLVSKNEKEIYLYTEDCQQRSNQVNQQKIVEGTTVSAYVAATMSGIFVHDILGSREPWKDCHGITKKMNSDLSHPKNTLDERFPNGVGLEDNMAQSVICQPIIQSDGKLAGVAELVRVLGNQPFEPEDDEITTSYLTWGGITIHYAQIFKEMQRQKNLHSFLLDVIKSLFDEEDTVDGVITNVMTYAKKLVDADRCAMFLSDEKNEELYADLFDEGMADGNGRNVFTKGKEIRFSTQRGIAGYVATSGKLLNIKDAYSDPRFNREVDVKTGYTTHTILCVPIKCKDRVVGVVQLVNKCTGVFTSADEHSFTLFAGYCGLAIRYSQIFNHLFETRQKHLIALDVLSYHCRASEKDVQKFRNMTEPVKIPDEFWSYNFNYYQEPDYAFRLFLMMAERLFEDCKVSVDPDTLCRFALTVRKNYRQLMYHNWLHAFSVTHTVLLYIHHSPDMFTSSEKLGLFFAALCHDIDHRGYTNSFMQLTKSPIGLLYQTSTLEKHHLDHTLYLLQLEDLNIFENVDPNQHNEIIGVIKEAILATDLAEFIQNHTRLEPIVLAGEFDVKNEEHRTMFRKLLMTSADICAVAKPWNIHRQSVKKIVEEFYAQGDMEKEMGYTPLPLLDRDRKNELPEGQIAFFSGYGTRCYTMLQMLLPSTEAMLDNVKENLEEWKRVAGIATKEKKVTSKEEANRQFEYSKELMRKYV